MFTAVLPVGNWSNNGTTAGQEQSDDVPARITVHPPKLDRARLTAGTMRMRRCNTRRCFDPSQRNSPASKAAGSAFGTPRQVTRGTNGGSPPRSVGAEVKIFAMRAGPQQPVDRNIGSSFRGAVLPSVLARSKGLSPYRQPRRASIFPGCSGFLTSWITARRSLRHPR